MHNSREKGFPKLGVPVRGPDTEDYTQRGIHGGTCFVRKLQHV